MKVFYCAALAVLVGVCLSACNDGGSRSGSAAGTGGGGGEPLRYDVQVRRTSYGIPHINAGDYGSLGYGYGYVHAQDNLCVLARDLLTIRGERARYFGRDGSHVIVPNGSVASNVDSDFFWRFIATDEAIEPLRANSDPEAREATRGFVDGYNRYVRELKDGAHPGRHEDCRGEPWLQEITEDDMYRRYYRLALIASTSVFVEGVATAAPPGPDNPPLAVDTAAIAALDPDALPFPLGGELPIGSNMYALGPEATESGRPMLFGNPHFPWLDTERLYLAHMTIGNPGDGGPPLDIMGASLYGVPAALIGFNDRFAWSHTVSTAFRFTFYELTLNPADPTQYLYNGEFLPMEATEVSVDVLGEDDPETRTLYRSRYGPMLEFQVEQEGQTIPVLEWSYARAYTLRDANAENDRLVNQFFRWNRARDLAEFKALHATVLGVPWVNTAATGPGEDAYYGDISVVPNVTDAKAALCGTSPLALAFRQLSPGLPVLDGARPDCEWDTDEDAPAPGIFGPANLPTLEHPAWVHNCNDSYWLSNPDAPLTGFAAIVGDENTARSLRTRLCMLQVIRRLDNSDGLTVADVGAPVPDGKFNLETLQHVVLDSYVYSAELGRQAVLDSYCRSPLLSDRDGPVVTDDPATERDIAGACDVLGSWDNRNNLTSVGGHIWREFWRNVDNDGAATWLVPFTALDPVNTPSHLNVLNPLVEEAFVDGMQKVLASPFELTAPMGEIQHSGIHLHDHAAGDEGIPVFGGEGFEGSFTIANASGMPDGSFEGGLSGTGYEIIYGNSYIQTVTWDENDNPIAAGFVTYSQSTDPASPYYRDMTEAYSKKQWIAFPFREEAIREDVQETLHLTEIE